MTERMNASPRRTFLKTMLQAGAAATFTSPVFALEKKAHTTPVTAAPSVQLNVRDFGAIGDGITLETESLQRTIDRCGVLGGGEVIIPAGRYLTGSVSLRTKVTLRLAAECVILGSPDLAHYAVSQVRWEGKWIPGYLGLIHALDARKIAVLGPGSIEGNVAVAGRPTKENPLRRPALIEFLYCDDVHLEGFSTSYAHMWSIHPTCCDNLVFRNLTVRSTLTNGDGIDIDSCRHVLIDTCDIASGDDCISLKSGRGEEAYQLARPTEDVRIVNCTLEGRGFACIGIGSETSAGIRRVLIEGCRVTSVYKFAVYIKSRVGRGAFIEDLTVRDMSAAKMRMGFLKISQTSAGVQDENPVPGLDGLPLFRNISFLRIHVDDAPVLVEAKEISADKLLDGLTLDGFTGTCAKGLELANITHATLRGIAVSGFTGPLLRIDNVTGKGLQGAEKLPPRGRTELVATPAVPYKLH
ncbi:glycoside hydrolase family 28 protein [Granulicella tundricola]|uniref:Glycoside hydrolase family 28 n=1 Tax=Granulicella tundricola (strain ATCC BAA-1859 / DSM 23138 / MP5ACTX9) TaxID=1198114 RepID=E8X714_GRATM|nr:glycoside hydrolase family 28 protein [Granulicella tundricola]ADW71123.1 glycoside hydrolase family 28 [Granulicella tundricola MP5ACTX9]